MCCFFVVSDQNVHHNALEMKVKTRKWRPYYFLSKHNFHWISLQCCRNLKVIVFIDMQSWPFLYFYKDRELLLLRASNIACTIFRNKLYIFFQKPTSGFCFKNMGNREKARNVDRISRVVFPTVFTLFNLIYWIVYFHVVKTCTVHKDAYKECSWQEHHACWHSFYFINMYSTDKIESFFVVECTDLKWIRFIQMLVKNEKAFIFNIVYFMFLISVQLLLKSSVKIASV